MPEDIQKRWISRGLAIKVEEVELTRNELYQACLEKGLEVKPKKPREYYLNMLGGKDDE